MDTFFNPPFMDVGVEVDIYFCNVLDSDISDYVGSVYDGNV